MVGDDGEPRLLPGRLLRKGRLEAFSDGVFAIAVTLLVLEISVPDGSEDDLFAAVLDQWPSYLGYVAAFSTMGVMWIAHSAITEYLDRAVAVMTAVVWRYALRRGLLRADVDDEEIRTLTARLTPGLGGYVGMIVVGLFLPTVAVIGYLMIAVALLVVPLFSRKRAHA